MLLNKILPEGKQALEHNLLQRRPLEQFLYLKRLRPDVQKVGLTELEWLGYLMPVIDDRTFAAEVYPLLQTVQQQEPSLQVFQQLADIVKLGQKNSWLSGAHKQIIQDYLAGLPINAYPLRRQVHYFLGQPTAVVLDGLRKMQYGLDVARLPFVEECILQAKTRMIRPEYEEALVTKRVLLWADQFVNEQLGLRKLGEVYTFTVFDTGTKTITVEDTEKTQITSLVAYKLRLGQPQLEEFVWKNDSCETYEAFLRFIQGTVLVGHNIDYDREVVNAALAEHGLPRLTNNYFCTYRFANARIASVDNTIEGLTQYLRIWHDPERSFHVTKHDARYTVDVFLRELLSRPDLLLSIKSTKTRNKLRIDNYLHMSSLKKENDYLDQKYNNYLIDEEEVDEFTNENNDVFQMQHDACLTRLGLTLEQPDHTGTVYYKHPYIRDRVMTLTGYEYQYGLPAEILEKKRSLLIMDTGLGKTPILFMAMIAHWAQVPNAKILLITPTKLLAHQHYDGGDTPSATMSFKKLLHSEYFEQVEFFTGDTPQEKRQTNAKVTVANAQVIAAMKNKEEFLGSLTMIVSDETHNAHGEHAMAQILREALVANPELIVCGATATATAEEQFRLKTLLNTKTIVRPQRSLLSRPDIVKQAIRLPAALSLERYALLHTAYTKLYTKFAEFYPTMTSFISPFFPLRYGPYDQIIMRNLHIRHVDLEALRKYIDQRILALSQKKKETPELYTDRDNKSRQNNYLAKTYLSALERLNHLHKVLTRYGQYEAYRYLQEKELEMQKVLQEDDFARTKIKLIDNRIYFNRPEYELNRLALTEKDLGNLYERRRKINIAYHVHPGTDVESVMVFWHMPEVQQIYAQLKERYEHPWRKHENEFSVQRALSVFRAEDYIAKGQYGYAYRELLKCLPYTDIADLKVLLPLMKICAEKKKKTIDLWYIEQALQIPMSSAKSDLCRLVELYRSYLPELRETILSNGCIDPDREIAEDPKMQAIWDIHETYPQVKKIYFCDTKETVYKVLSVFQSKGVPATELVGKKGELGLTERKQYEHLKKFRDTEVQVAVSTKEMAGEGMDIPGLAITVLTSPTTSPQMSKQTDGRVRKPIIINGQEVAANIVLRTAVYEDSAYYLGQRRVKQMVQDNL